MSTVPELPSDLYTAADVRAMDRYAIDVLGIPGIELMERAGAAALACLRSRWPAARTVSVLCGAGNNGGDGYIVARLAHQAGLDVRAYPVAPVDKLRGDAALAYEAYRQAGGPLLDFVPANFDGAAVLVDALLGTGLDREIDGLYADVIAATRRYTGGILALDIPSGLHADSGRVLGCALRADLTVSFIGLKRGLFTGDGPEYVGTVCFDALGTPSRVQEQCRASARLLPPMPVPMPRRNRNAHKGHFGHVLVIGGDHGYSGAARMAAEAAARVGAGLVSVATRPAHATVMNIGRPELMCVGIDDPTSLEALLQRATVVVIGPGLGQSVWAQTLFQGALNASRPTVIDADGLNLLAAAPQRRSDWVLTPHPGEAARLLGTDSSGVQSDRFEAVDALRQRYGGTVVLKGAGTLVAGECGVPAICRQGNPGMASGGMGDVLAGVIAGIIAQGIPPQQATEFGVLLHATAADLSAADCGERGLLASDLFPYLRRLVNGC